MYHNLHARDIEFDPCKKRSVSFAVTWAFNEQQDTLLTIGPEKKSSFAKHEPGGAHSN